MKSGYIVVNLKDVTTEPRVIKGLYAKVSTGKPIAFDEWTYLTNKGIASFGTGSYKEVGGLFTCVLGVIASGRVLLTVDIDDTAQIVFEAFNSPAVLQTAPVKQTKPAKDTEKIDIPVTIPEVIEETPTVEKTDKAVE